MKSYLTRFFPIFVLLVAFTLRLWHLGTNELWFDETASTFIANKSIPNLIHYTATAGYEHPPLYYILLNLWTKVAGESEFAIRFLSVIFNMLMITLLARLAYRLANEQLALWVLAITTFAPFLILHSQEARMYNFVMLLSVLVMWATEGILNQRRGALPLFCISVGLGMATSYFFSPIIIAFDLILLWRRPLVVRRWWRTFIGLHGIAIAIVMIFFALPGPRQTFFTFFQNRPSIWTWPIKISKALSDLNLAYLDESALGLSAFFIFFSLTLLGALVRELQSPQLPLFPFFFITFVFVAILPVLDGRYFSAGLVVVYVWIASGMIWLRSQHYRLFLLILPFLCWSLLFPLWRYYQEDKGYFGAALTKAAMVARGPQDILLLLEPDSWPQVDFYTRRLPFEPTIFYVPPERRPIQSNEVVERLNPILNDFDRVILGPVAAKNQDPESLVEHYLLEHAFAANREFWPDSTMVAVFVSPSALASGPNELDFGQHVRLAQSDLSTLDVPAGGEIAARLQWMALSNEIPRFAVSLQLQDEIGQVWVAQQTEPCNGWCASPSWQQNEIVIDNRALIIPNDLPAGSYVLMLRLDAKDGAIGNPQQLGTVEVRPGEFSVSDDEENEPFATLADIEISDLSVTPQTLQIRQEITWQAKFRPTTDAPPNWQLMWHLIQDQTIKQSWQVPASRVSYPSEAWQPHQIVSGQGRLEFGSHLLAGEYELQVQITSPNGKALSSQLPISQITLMDRNHYFDLPNDVKPDEVVRAEWQQGVQLYAGSVPIRGTAGETQYIRLIWRARGPTDRSYKIFVHLRDKSNNTIAQQDILPASGQAPSNSWVENEVIVDELDLLLPANLPVGSYKIMVGFYHEASGERLWRTEDQGNEFELSTIEVEGP